MKKANKNKMRKIKTNNENISRKSKKKITECIFMIENDMYKQ